jgi:hypothetical protein
MQERTGYITLVVDIKDSKVIFACEGKDSSTIPVLAKICKIIMETQATLDWHVAICLPHISVEFQKNFHTQKLRLFVVLCGYPHNMLIKSNAVLN